MYRLAEALFRVFFMPLAVVTSRVLFGYSSRGTRFLPREGPCLVVSNHQGYLDPFFVQMATVRPIRFLMTSRFYDIRYIQPFFKLIHAIRVAEDGPNRNSLRNALDRLKSGEIVGIFPEGRLSLDGSIGSIMPGVAFLAAKSGVPVVPVRIDGSIRVMAKGRPGIRQAAVQVRFGPPIHLTRGEAADKLMEAWRRL